MGDTLLEITQLKTYLTTDIGEVRAVDGVDLTVRRERVVGIVGESGCGKTMTAYSILQLLPPVARIASGSIRFFGATDSHSAVDLTTLAPDGREMRHIRGKEIAMIFQEPMSSLSPVHTIGNQIMEGILYHMEGVTKKQARDQAIDVMRKVGIPHAETRLNTYTFELSGGLRQRAMIASALARQPKLLIADEPTTAIDVTIQAQILDLLSDLKAQYAMSIVIITHDLGVVAEMADEIGVMYLGQMVEMGSVYDVFEKACHPYTQALLESIPRFRRVKDYLPAVRGTVPDPYSRPNGCGFAPRCDYARDVCDQAKPELVQVGDDHFVQCVLQGDSLEARRELRGS